MDGEIPNEYPGTLDFTSSTSIIIEAVPVAGYHFIRWDTEVKGIKKYVNPFEISLVRDIELTAVFSPDFYSFTSEDGSINVAIPTEGTALDSGGNPLSDVEFTAEASPPSLPPDKCLVGHAYDLSPEGATFSPPATLTWGYQTAYLQENVSEDDLSIAYYDEDQNEWMTIDSDIDTSETTITAPIEHLSTFAILAPYTPSSEDTPPTASLNFTTSSLDIYPPGEIIPGSLVTISVLVTNANQTKVSNSIPLKIDGETEETQRITLENGESQTITFTTFRNEGGTYMVDINGLSESFTVTANSPTPPSVTPTPTQNTTIPSSLSSESEINWVIMTPILAAIFLSIFLPIKLRKRRRGPLDW